MAVVVDSQLTSMVGTLPACAAEASKSKSKAVIHCVVDFIF